MPIRVEFPLVKTFGLVTYQDEGYTSLRRARDGENPDGYVTFRQAAISEAETRTGIVSKRKYSQDEDSMFTITDDTNLDLLARMEVSLTLAGTDLEVPDGKDEAGNLIYMKPEFYEPQGFAKIKNANQFNRWWSILPVQWGRTIHECCLEVNPNWALKS